MSDGKSRMVSFGAALVGDIISLSVPVGGFFAKLVDEHIARRTQEAVEIALEELAQGKEDFDEQDAQPFVAILLRYSKAASEGASRQNLRLLMQIVVGLKRNKALSEDLFKRWAGILEHMTRDELMLVGHAISLQRRIDAGEEEPAHNFWSMLREALERSGYTGMEPSAIAAAVSRSGLIIPASAFGGLSYRPSPWLGELSRLVDVQTLTEQ